MSSPPVRGVGQSHVALHVVALTTVLAFGCTTVRAPVSGIGPTVAVHGNTAEPQVELWLESAGDLTPAESARAAAEAREALRQALQERTLGVDDVLVVRAQAVSRTRSHRSDQHAAIAGLVVGAVVLVALAVVASRGNGARLPAAGGHAGRAAGAFRPGTVPPSAGGFRPGAVPLRPVIGPNVPPGRIAAPSRPDGPNLDVDVAVGTPAENDAAPAVDPVAAEDLPATEYFLVPPPAAAAGMRISAVTLPAPSPLALSHRSFFDGDWLRLELVVVDARTGEVRWAKTVADELDVRDARKVRHAIDEALATEDGWYMPAAVAR